MCTCRNTTTVEPAVKMEVVKPQNILEVENNLLIIYLAIYSNIPKIFAKIIEHMNIYSFKPYYMHMYVHTYVCTYVHTTYTAQKFDL